MAETTLVAKAVFILLIVVSLFQLWAYWGAYRRLAFYRKKPAGVSREPVSVIVCARNEAERLRRNLPEILNQDYPSFEVIVVNDCSWDETDLVLNEFARQYKHLRIVTINEQEKYRHGKKFALTLGIKAATYDLLLLTDADCRPASSQWLSLMQGKFEQGKEIVLGYGAYEKYPGLLNRLIRFDTLHSAMQYLSCALGGSPYMGVGRNLAYRKPLFFKSKGFARHNHILSGDDDLFVNENSTRSNTSIEIAPESFTISEPKKSFSSWFYQKRRHFSTSKYYRTSHLFSLALRNGSLTLFYISLIVLFSIGSDWRIPAVIYLFMLLVRLPVFYRSATKLKEKDLVWMFPLLEFLHAFLMPFFYTANLLTKQKTWK